MAEDVSLEDIDNMSDEDFQKYMEESSYKDTKEEETPTDDNNIQDNSTSEEEEIKPEEISVNEPKAEENKPVEDTKTEESSEESKPTEEINYEDFYKTVMKPFKANGKEITPNNVNDIISLMQMGANYTKKMQTIAPVRKTYEMLNKSGIDTNELNFLIDLHNGNKQAIKELVKRSNMDITDLDITEDDDSRPYIATNHEPSDEEMQFVDVRDDLTPDQTEKIKDILTNQWDNESRKQLAANPQLIRDLATEIDLGRFDTIQKMVETERVYGRHKDKSDLALYIDIVTNWVNQQNQQYQQQQVQQQQIQQTQQQQNKMKAAPTKKSAGTPKTSYSVEDLYKMSDEELSKLSII